MPTNEERKLAHLALCLDESTRGSGAELDHLHLPYDALFEMPPERLDTASKIAGIAVKFPLMFGAMTGGIPQAAEFNTALRKLAQTHGLAMCLGSIRVCLENDSLHETYGTGEVEALFANLGASEIKRYKVEYVAEKCKRLGCAGLFIHLNGLQEYVQDEGNHAFCCNYEDLQRFVEAFPMPVLIKEVGSGIGGGCANRLGMLPIAGIETSSRGGTSWIKIEAMRRQVPISGSNITALDQIGYSLESSIHCCRAALGDRTLIASGGIRHALDLVKALSLGADLVAIAQPLYRAYHDHQTAGIESLVQEWIDIGRLIWRSTGCPNLASLRMCLTTPA